MVTSRAYRMRSSGWLAEDPQAKADPDNAFIGECYQRTFPERLTLAPFRPDEAYIDTLREVLPTVDLSNFRTYY
jgi:hypothetical protein